MGEMFKVMTFMLILVHFVTCFWIMLGNEGSCDLTWLDDVWCGYGGSELYFVGYHWSFSQFISSSEPVPRNTLERLFAIAVLVVGFAVLAVVPPRITTLMTMYQAAKAERTTNFQQLTRFMQEKGISQHLAVRV